MKNTRVNLKECIKCGGICCKSLPGILDPADIIEEYGKINTEIIISLLISGRWCIDWWESSPNIYFMRPARKGCKKVFDPAYSGECVFFTDKGCDAPFKPKGCVDLVPRINKCKLEHDKKYYADKGQA